MDDCTVLISWGSYVSYLQCLGNLTRSEAEAKADKLYEAQWGKTYAAHQQELKDEPLCLFLPLKS